MGKTLLEVTVKETKKCRYPSKYYVYVLEVTWSEGTSTIIYRRYSDFFEFQCGLLEKFPEEAGFKDPSARIIPFLPGKKLLGRSQVRSVAEKRRDQLNDYCRALVRLPPKISDDEFVHNFFELRLEDLHDPSKADKGKTAKGLASSGDVEEISGPMVLERYVAVADYEKQKKNECSLTAGQMVEVIDKNQNGWWFVSLDNFNEGWVPATYLDPLYGTEEAQVEEFSPGQEQYVTTSGYHAQHQDELSFEKGVIVDVCTKGLDGWWKVRYKDREGMAPAAYLNRYHGPQLVGANPAQLVGSVRDAVLQASGTNIEAKPKHSWQPSARADEEPIYAPTPRKMSVKRQVKRCAPPPPVPSSPSGTTAGSSTSLPSSPTGPLDGPVPIYEVIPEPEEEIYITIANFQSSSAGDGLSFSAGSSVTVVTKNPSGWWYVEMGEEEGWVPSSYLERKANGPVSPVASAVPAPQLIKSSPVQRRLLPQSSKNSLLRHSTSEESLTTKPTATKPTPPHHSPAAKRAWFSNSVSNPQFPVLHHRPTISTSPSTNKSIISQEERSLPAKQRVKKTPVFRSSSSEEQSRHHPRPSPRAQNHPTNLTASKQPVRSHSASSREGPAKPRLDTPRAENKQVAELTRVLQKQATPTDTKTAPPRSMSKSISPSTTKRVELTRKQRDWPNPRTASVTAKKTPPKRPEPPKASAISAAKKTAPPRPSTSPGQKRKMSAYSVGCDYDGGDGRLPLKKGQSVEVLEKNSDGWWYVKVGVKEGWAPASFLEEGKVKPVRPTNSPPQPAPHNVESSKPSPTPRPVPKPRVRSQVPNSNTYRAAALYQVPAYEDSGIDLVRGELYKVLEKAEGWWFVTDGQKDGWAPASYLDPA